jgi:hypothetical protein
MKLASHIEPFVEDARVVIESLGIDLTNADHGISGLKVMHGIHTVISRNRAYDDSHPFFASGHWTRCLPYDGRDYCWLYEGGCNDTHVETLLRRVKSILLTAHKPCPNYTQ